MFFTGKDKHRHRWRFLSASSVDFLIALVALFGMGIGGARAEWDEWIADGELAYETHDNINHAVFKNARESDQLGSAYAAFGRNFQLADSTRVHINTRWQGEIHDKFSQLDQFSLGAELAVRHKFGIGQYQPWLRGSIATRHIFSRSQLRNGQLTTAGVEFGKPVHERVDLAFSYLFDYRNSDTGPAVNPTLREQTGIDPSTSRSVYDLNGQTVAVRLDFFATEQLALVFRYAYRDGDIVSTNSPRLVPQLVNIIDALANDDALPGWAYRANGQTHLYNIDADYGFFQGRAVLNIGYQHTDSDAGPFSYRDDMFRMSVVYNY